MLISEKQKQRDSSLPILPGVEDIEKLECCKRLGVTFNTKLKMSSDVRYILSQFAQRMHLLKLLQHQGMSCKQLTTVAYSLAVSRFLCTLPAWESSCLLILSTKSTKLLRTMIPTRIQDCCRQRQRQCSRNSHRRLFPNFHCKILPDVLRCLSLLPT